MTDSEQRIEEMIHGAGPEVPILIAMIVIPSVIGLAMLIGHFSV